MAGKIESIITMDGKQPIKVLQILLDKAKELTDQMKQMKPGTEEYKEAEAKVKALQSAQVQTIKTTERLEAVVNDLSNTSLRNLRRALGEGKRKLEGLSEADEEEAKHIRSLMKEVGDEVRLLEGKYVKIEEGLKNVRNQSDQWLSKAINQQKDLVGSLEKTDASYQHNLSTLKQLEVEEDRRKGKMGITEARQAVNDSNASASDLRRAKATITETRDRVPTGNASAIETYNREIQTIEERLDAVSGKAQKAAISWQQMRQVLSNPGKASGEDIKRTMDAIQQKIQQLPAGSKAVSDLRKQYAQLEQTLKGTRLSQTQLNDIVARSKTGKANINELRQAYKQLEEELNQINTKSEAFANRQKELKNLKKVIDDATGAANKQSNAWHTALKNLTAYVGMFAIFNQAKTLLTGVITKNLEMSDSLANIRKVSGLLHQDIDKMAVSLSKIDTRTSVQELQNIAYAGAKLGIGEYGPEGLESFVKAANQVNVALKEDLGDEALTALSKITEVMGLIPKMGVEQSMLKTGSAIFKLASTSTATSGKIIDFSNRLLAMGKVGTLSTSDILALGAAVDSMAIEPEVASTAFAKLITEIRKGTTSIEHDLGLAKGTLSSFLEQGRGIEALQTIFHKMRESGNVFALDSLFKDLGSDGSRLVKVMVTMAEKADMLDKAVATSRQAFNEGMAVTQEYNIQQDTAKGILERANNMWNKAFTNPDGINSVKQLTMAWYDLSRALTTSTASQKAVLGSIDLIVLSCKTLIALLPTLLGFFIGKGLAMAAVQLINISKAVWAWVIAQRALNLAMASNVFGLAIGVLSTLYAYFQKNANAAQDAANAADRFTKSLGNAKAEVGRAKVELDDYKRAIDGAKKGTKERQAAIDQFNNKFGSYLSKLITEKSTVNDLKRAYNEAADAIERKVMALAREKDIEQHVAPKGAREAQLLYNYDQHAQKSRMGQYGSTWLKGFVDDNLEKHGLNYTINEIIRRSGVGKNYDSQHRKGLITAIMNTNGSPSPSYTWLSTSKGSYGETHINRNSKKFTDEERMTAMAVAYIRQRGARVKSQQEVNKKYKDYPELFLTENPGGVITGGGSSGGNTNSGKNDKTDNTAKQEEQKAKTRANALIANIKAFYEEQKRKYLEWVTQMNADGEKVSEGQQQQMLTLLDNKMQTALGTARKSIATTSDEFKKFFSHMDEDVLVYDDETSKSLLEAIGKSDIKELHNLFEKLSGDLSRENNQTLSENLGALLDQIFANGSKELRNAAEKLLARQREIQKILNENDFTGAVNRSTRSNFDTLGFLRPAQNVRADSKEGLESMNAAFDKLTSKVRSTLSILYQLNPESVTFQQQFLQYLSVANDGFDFTKLTTQELKALYIELIKYTDSYTEAEKRKYDQAKKVADQAWAVNQRNLANQEALRKMQQESSLFGKRTNMWSNLGLADLTADPEVELMKLKMQMAEDYYAFVFKNSRNQQLIDEADKARQEAELAYANQMATAMKNRLSQMQSLVQPIETFGGEVGKAFAQMRNDVSGAQEAIKNALKSMLESWANMALNDVNTQMWKAINDAGAKRGKKKAQPGIDAARANADANAIKEDFSDLGTKANPMYVRLVDEGAAYLTPQPESNFEKMTPQQQPIGWNPDGSPIMPNGPSIVPPYAPTATPEQPNTQSQGSGAPRAWEHRNRDNANAFYNDAATQTGVAAADAIAGGGSFMDTAAGITGSFIGGVMNTEFKTGGKSKEDKEKADQLKKEKKHQKELSKEVKKGNKDREKVTTQGVQNITNVTDAGNKEQTEGTKIALNTGMAMTQTALTENLNATQENNEAITQSDADRTQAGMTFSIAGAIGKCFDFLGPIAGPIAAAGVMATLMGLLQWALNSAFSGSKKKSNTSSTNTKLVTGMLTYDSGNVQDLKPFVADNGEVYWAKEDDGSQMQGVKILTSPTATTVNGQPSLVAERGPEIVIGRETTHAMMMNNPQLLRTLVNYDRNYSGRNSARRAFDDGNVSDVLAAGTQAGNGNLSSGALATGDLIAASAASNAALLQAVNALLNRLSQPINAKINMFGRGELYDSMNKANQFMKNK